MSVNEGIDVVRLLVPKVNTHSCETVSAMGDEVPQDLDLLRLSDYHSSLGSAQVQ